MRACSSSPRARIGSGRDMSTWLGTARSWRRGLALRVVILLVAVPFVGSACESDDSGRNRSGSAANPDDKLAIVTGRGTLLLPTDTAYPPASFAVKSAARRPDTECAENELTGPEVDGYDVAVSKAVAAALKLEPCFVTPTFTQQLAGNWGDRWDVAFTSIGIVRSRMRNLYFTQPYYATPERFFVRRGGPIRRIEQLDGARIGVCTGCFADLYLQRRLDIPGTEVGYRVRRSRQRRLRRRAQRPRRRRVRQARRVPVPGDRRRPGHLGGTDPTVARPSGVRRVHRRRPRPRRRRRPQRRSSTASTASCAAARRRHARAAVPQVLRKGLRLGGRALRPLGGSARTVR